MEEKILDFDELVNYLKKIHKSGAGYKLKFVGHPGERGSEIKKENICVDHYNKTIFFYL
jgi:hypothetical protein